jgi:hypothetical protein
VRNFAEEGKITNVIVQDLFNVFSGFFKLAVLAGVALYACLVLVNYRTVNPRVRPHVDWHDPAQFAERWAIWLGVVVVSLAARLAAPLLGMLSEASADVGEWFLDHRRHES